MSAGLQTETQQIAQHGQLVHVRKY